MRYRRADRLGELIQEEVSSIIQQEIKDPRIGFVTVTAVEVTDDLRHARIFVSIYGDESIKERTMKGLQSASGFIRSEMGHRIRLKYIPEIRFEIDESLERAAQIFNLMKRIKEEEEGRK